jgi:hypothetical protein
MNYKKINEELEILLIGTKEDVSTIEDSFLYKLRSHNWDESQYQEICCRFEGFGKTLTAGVELDSDCIGVLELLLIFLGDVMIYLEKDKERQLKEYERIVGFIGNGAE